MPCAGPTMPTDEEVNVVFDDVLSYIREKHNLIIMPEEAMQTFMKFHRLKGINDLREAIREIMKQTAFEEF